MPQTVGRNLRPTLCRWNTPSPADVLRSPWPEQTETRRSATQGRSIKRDYLGAEGMKPKAQNTRKLFIVWSLGPKALNYASLEP